MTAIASSETLPSRFCGEVHRVPIDNTGTVYGHLPRAVRNMCILSERGPSCHQTEVPREPPSRSS